MTDVTLSRLLRDRTRALHERVESAPFLRNLMAGRIERGAYARLVESLYFVYATMESALDHHRCSPFVSLLDFRELRRLESLEEDLSYWVGPSWRDSTSPSPATRAYVSRIRAVATNEPPRLVGHLYARYLGDLSGGEILGRAIARAFGSAPESGAAFYRFEGVANRSAFKERYRGLLDTLPLSDGSAELIVDEAERAFALNLLLFEELAA